jgi:hypothetical protein
LNGGLYSKKVVIYVEFKLLVFWKARFNAIIDQAVPASMQVMWLPDAWISTSCFVLVCNPCKIPLPIQPGHIGSFGPLVSGFGASR